MSGYKEGQVGRRWLAAGVALGALAMASAAGAQVAGTDQTSPQAPARDAAQVAAEVGAPVGAATASVGEIVVTARKREERLQNVPIAISAFTAERLQDKLARNLADVAQFTPGLQIQEAFGRQGDRPIIRGASNIIATDAKVGVFLDGIPFLGDFTSLDLENAARVEVIKGPQAAVFGRGTLTGAINVVLQKPGDQIHGDITGTIGSYNRFEIGGNMSGPITPWLGGQFGFKAFKVNGQYDNNAVPGTTLGGQSTSQITAALYFKPLPTFNASLRYLRANDDDQHYAVTLQPASLNNCFLTTRPYYCGVVPVPPDSQYAINTNRLQRPGLYRTADRGFGEASWDILGSGYVLSYQTGLNKTFQVVGTDQSYDARDFFVFGSSCRFIPVGNQNCAQSAFNTTSASERHTWSNEIRLTSPGTQRLRWRVGAFFLRDVQKPLAEYLEASEAGLDTLGEEITVNDSAVFGGIDFDILPNLTLGLELRHQNEDVSDATLAYRAGSLFAADYLSTLTFGATPYGGPNQIVGAAALRKASFEATLPRATLTWRPSRDLTLYAQYAEGNSPGGFNPIDAPQTSYQEERLTNYEVGIKTQKFGFEYLNLALYYEQYSNQVLTNVYVTSIGGLNSFKANIGETEIKGLELEGSRRLLIPELRLNFTYAYTDAEITQGVEPEQAVLLLGKACATGTAADLTKPGCFAAGSIAGKTPPLVSRHMASIGLRYDRANVVGSWAFFAGADVIYRSSFYDQVMNLAETGDSTRLNLQAGVHDDKGLRVTLYGRNVGDDRTPVGILRYVDLVIGTPKSPSGLSTRAFAITPPRKPEFGVTLTKRF